MFGLTASRRRDALGWGNEHKYTFQPRPALNTLAFVNERCTLYGQAGQDNLTVRKTYGKDGIRYLLHCRCCGAMPCSRRSSRREVRDDVT
jgi:hypothetical protein